ncbi:hypothetical protein D6779_04010 [Candidatus Parcubacteria bacterium]|nr:MAG: hypothetical protein D6779_04010 [Candidatus Parcubacteria bacterium]
MKKNAKGFYIPAGAVIALAPLLAAAAGFSPSTSGRANVGTGPCNGSGPNVPIAATCGHKNPVPPVPSPAPRTEENVGHIGGDFSGALYRWDLPFGFADFHPPATARVGERYFYPVAVENPNKFPVTFQLLQGPEGMQLVPSGLTMALSWTPRSEQAAQLPIPVALSISDGYRTARGEFAITEISGATAPQQTAAAQKPSANPPSATPPVPSSGQNTPPPRHLAAAGSFRGTPGTQIGAGGGSLRSPVVPVPAEEVQEGESSGAGALPEAEPEENQQNSNPPAQPSAPVPPPQTAAVAFAGISVPRLLGILLVLAAIALILYSYRGVLWRRRKE